MLLGKQDQGIGKDVPTQLNKKYAFFIKNQDTFVQIVAELPNVFTVEDTVKYTLQQFNKELGTKFQMNNETEYQLRIAKKSGEPKSDLPTLDNEQILSETGCQLFTLIVVPSKKQTINQISNVTTTDASMQEGSIKSRTSYHNGLTKNQKQIDKKKQDSNGGFCFFKQCI